MSKILIVDDETDICDMIAFSFRSRGFTTLTAHNAEDAFELVKASQPDIVISDVKMPKGGGLKLLEDIQSLAEKKPKVFLITGYSDFPPEKMLKMGAEAIINKPLKLKDLVELVTSSFESYSS